MDEKWLAQLPVDQIQSATAVSGGDVNEAYKIKTAVQTYFLLVQPQTTKDFFETEAAGLRDLKKAGVTVPAVYGLGEIQSDAYLLISYLEEGLRGSYRDLAKMIAKMHRTSSPNSQFGYALPQPDPDVAFANSWTDSWSEFFVKGRLDKLRDQIIEKKQWNQQQVAAYEKARAVILEELAQHPSRPSLLHGDLWGGNHMFLTDGTPALFDPAPFYGDREFDLGVTTTFNGYPEVFYETYQETFPLAAGYEKRLPFYRLYLFMLHLLKFGGLYEHSVDQTLREILS